MATVLTGSPPPPPQTESVLDPHGINIPIKSVHRFRQWNSHKLYAGDNYNPRKTKESDLNLNPFPYEDSMFTIIKQTENLSLLHKI